MFHWPSSIYHTIKQVAQTYWCWWMRLGWCTTVIYLHDQSQGSRLSSWLSICSTVSLQAELGGSGGGIVVLMNGVMTMSPWVIVWCLFRCNRAATGPSSAVVIFSLLLVATFGSIRFLGVSVERSSAISVTFNSAMFVVGSVTERDTYGTSHAFNSVSFPFTWSW